LQQLEERQENVYRREAPQPVFEKEPTRPDVSIFDLITAVNAILKRVAEREADQREIFEDKWSVSEKIEMLAKLIAERSRLKFSELFEGATSRTEVVVTFLAMLELIRLKQIVCVQPDHFAEIEIIKAEPMKPTVATEIPDQAIFEDETAKRAVLLPPETSPDELQDAASAIEKDGEEPPSVSLEELNNQSAHENISFGQLNARNSKPGGTSAS